MPEPSLELLETMMQRMLDAQGLTREDLSNLRRRVGRSGHRLNDLRRDVVDLRRDFVDFSGAETDRQDQADRVSDRLEALESHTGLAPKR
jgi:hypothetical protein